MSKFGLCLLRIGRLQRLRAGAARRQAAEHQRGGRGATAGRADLGGDGDQIGHGAAKPQSARINAI